MSKYDQRIKQNIIKYLINPKYYLIFIKCIINRISKKITFKKNGISAHIRVKNEETTLKLCIESIIDFVDELIITYNNCTDNSENIIKELAKKYRKIKYYKWTKKPFIYWDYSNFGMKKCKYKWYMKVDADQIYCIDPKYRNIILNSKNTIIYENGGICFINNKNKYSVLDAKNSIKYLDENNKEHIISNKSENCLIFVRGIFDKYKRIDKNSYCEYMQIYDYKRNVIYLGDFFIHYIYIKRKIAETKNIKKINVNDLSLSKLIELDLLRYSKFINLTNSEDLIKVLNNFNKSKIRKNFHYEDKKQEWENQIY